MPKSTFYSAADYSSNAALAAILESAGEIVDGRFAVISERLYEVVSYNDCSDGSCYDVLTVHAVPDVFGSSYPINDAVLVEAHVWKDDADEGASANRKMVKLIQARLVECFS